MSVSLNMRVERKCVVIGGQKRSNTIECVGYESPSSLVFLSSLPLGSATALSHERNLEIFAP